MAGWVVEGKKGRWFLRGQTLPCHPRTDDNGNIITYESKAEAVKVRRALEQGLDPVIRDRADLFRERALTEKRQSARVIDYRRGRKP